MTNAFTHRAAFRSEVASFQLGYAFTYGEISPSSSPSPSLSVPVLEAQILALRPNFYS